MKTQTSTLFTEIQQTLSSLPTVSEERKQVLQPLVNYIQEKLNNKELINLNFICTHNSRRSHLSQVWAQTMAYHYQIPNVNTYSGGTEATAMNATVVTTLVDNGFQIQQLSDGTNPIYAVKYADNTSSIIGFSKKYDNDFNPTSAFGAIMTCSQADEGCPFIAGAEKRVPVTYEDPKLYDGTPLEKEKYLERSLQIAAEMHYVFSTVKA
ncbi:low molecular weight phosphatase family protein [Tenacibaculum singaporense]|uniref:Protein-tyrosine-phosphatase n=1 Tax=Tenacibaculum singaporense TaxID=2358479 RepID=A0A3S8R525_9FLAO|nr:protein-tyrosine-phosphatase [Tenacibaculum singaporense]AZJ34738.1 protein-tyrosine-phosphatase [Tenacibaculum singaporense]